MVTLENDLSVDGKCLSYRLVVISDIHFGKKATQAKKLFEFLSHISCEKLILNGDIFDGWHIEHKGWNKLTEMQLRCIDIIMAMAANGTEVVYIPGNHDEKLRRGRNRVELPAATTDFNLPYSGKAEFTNDNQLISAPINFKPQDFYIDKNGQRFLIIHGDYFDPDWLKGGELSTATFLGNIANHVGDRAYDLGVAFDRALSDRINDRYGTEISLANGGKQIAKERAGVIDESRRRFLEVVKSPYVDGVITGHTHDPHIMLVGEHPSMNSGDWIDNCSALVHDDNDDWKIIKWSKSVREMFELSAYPTKHDKNPFLEYRPLTEEFIKPLFQHYWPGPDRKRKHKDVPEFLRELV